MRRLSHGARLLRRGPVRRARGGARGLTMLETMIALLVASAGFAAILVALTQAKRAESATARAERELALARNLLEEAIVGALPQALRTTPESGLERWIGETDGLPWRVEARATLMRGADLRKRDPALAFLGSDPDQESGGPVFTADLLRVDVGRVSLSAARW